MATLPRRGAAGFAAAFAKLLPRGLPWPRDPDTVLMRLVAGLAAVWATVEDRAAVLLERESDPRFALDLLPDWERMLGLPDRCFGAGQTIEERRAQVIARLTARGGQSRAYFIALAESLGYVITITEYAPVMAGWSRCGDPFWAMGDPGIRYFWTVHIADPRVTWFRAGLGISGQDPHARIVRADDLECIFKRWKPAHTKVIFDYSGA